MQLQAWGSCLLLLWVSVHFTKWQNAKIGGWSHHPLKHSLSIQAFIWYFPTYVIPILQYVWMLAPLHWLEIRVPFLHELIKVFESRILPGITFSQYLLFLGWNLKGLQSNYLANAMQLQAHQWILSYLVSKTNFTVGEWASSLVPSLYFCHSKIFPELWTHCL